MKHTGKNLVQIAMLIRKGRNMMRLPNMLIIKETIPHLVIKSADSKILEGVKRKIVGTLIQNQHANSIASPVLVRSRGVSTDIPTKFASTGRDSDLAEMATIAGVDIPLNSFQTIL